MIHRIHEYRGQDIIVRYDPNRCIHAAECVSRLGDVFDTSRRRWVEPDNAPADEVATAVTLCPTGALHFERIDNFEREPIPSSNTITLVANGPIYVRGNVIVKDANGNVLLEDTRVALCRCGASRIKPFCDNAHISCDFGAGGMQREHPPAPAVPGQVAPRLVIEVEANGPYHVQGDVDIYTAHDRRIAHTNETWLCRCGASDDKPYCDSTHHDIAFTTE